MPVETATELVASPFASVIQDHLELKKQNAELDGNMPLDHYQIEDPFENHPLFKSEEQARIEEKHSTASPPSNCTPWPCLGRARTPPRPLSPRGLRSTATSGAVRATSTGANSPRTLAGAAGRPGEQLYARMLRGRNL